MLFVVKFGSSSLIDHARSVDRQRLGRYVDDIVAVRTAGVDVIVVSSGAIAAGLGILRRRRPRELQSLQAASSVGQRAVLAAWSQAFARHDIHTGQVLLTMHDIQHRASYVNARNTLRRLLGWGIVPIINENDAVATDEISFGDNDLLAAQVAVALAADRLILLTDADGIYDRPPAQPNARIVRRIEDVADLAQIDVEAPATSWGSGGMRSKIVAAEMAARNCVAASIGNAAELDIVQRIAAGDEVGTFVAPMVRREERSSYRVWLRHGKDARGCIHLDAGACRAVCEDGASVLVVGVQRVSGAFTGGDAVLLCDDDGRPFGKGITQYSSAEVSELLARTAAERRGLRAIVDRDQLLLDARLQD